MRLALRFFAVFLILAWAPLAFVGTRLVRETEAGLRRAALASHAEAARRAADAVSARRERSEALLHLFARHPDVLSTDPVRRQAALSVLIRNDDLAEDVALYDALGRGLAQVSRAEHPSFSPSPDWGALRRALLDRGVLCGDDVAGGLFSCAAALPSLPGAVGGFLIERFRADRLAAAPQGSPPPPGRITLMDDAGQAIAGAGIPAPDGIDASAPVPGSRWTLSLHRAEEDLYKEVHVSRRRLRAALLWTAAAAALACLAMTGLLLRPVDALRRAVRRMKDGDFRAPLPAEDAALGGLAADLQDAQRALEKKGRDAALGRMARMIGHDLRAPLDALERAIEPLELADPRRAAIAKDSLASAREFCEQMLAVGRDEKPALRPLDLNALAADIVGDVFAGRGPAAVTEWTADAPRIRADPALARRALTNVIKNAWEAARLRVTIKTTADGGRARVEITDDGPGIPSEKQARMFEEFSTKDGGAGLGLLVVKKAMDLHGGTVAVVPAPGGGTTVRLEFPLPSAS